MTMTSTVLRRPGRPRSVPPHAPPGARGVVAEDAPAPAKEVSVARGWVGLRREVLGTFRAYGAVDLEMGRGQR